MLATRFSVLNSRVHSVIFKVPKSRFCSSKNSSTMKRYDVKIKLPENLKEAAKEIREVSLTKPMRIGRFFLAAASSIGLAGVVYYGLGLSSEIGILENSVLWTDKIRDRVHATYAHVAGGLFITGVSAKLTYRSKTMLALIEGSSKGFSSYLFSAAIVAGLVAMVMIPYEENSVFDYKHAAWALHTGLVGAMLGPLGVLGGPLITRAITYTASIVGGLSLVAITAPSQEFLKYGGFVAMMLSCVCGISIVDLVLKSTIWRVSAFAVSLYGGIVVFALSLLYNTQLVIKRAEEAEEYDPILESINIYLDVVNLFIRVLTYTAVNETNTQTDNDKDNKK